MGLRRDKCRVLKLRVWTGLETHPTEEILSMVQSPADLASELAKFIAVRWNPAQVWVSCFVNF